MDDVVIRFLVSTVRRQANKTQIRNTPLLAFESGCSHACGSVAVEAAILCVWP